MVDELHCELFDNENRGRYAKNDGNKDLGCHGLYTKKYCELDIICVLHLPGIGISEEKCLFFRQINNEERGVGRLVGKKVSYSKKFCEFDFCEYPSIRK